MIALDANLLIYAYIPTFKQHDEARDWLEGQFQRAPRIGFPWPSLLAFVRVVSSQRAISNAVSLGEAWTQVESWLAAENAWIPVPGRQHLSILGQCLDLPGIRPDDVPDAHLAALAIEHGLTLASNDTGFARFPDLRWITPLSRISAAEARRRDRRNRRS